jgi:phosphatidylinositol glycan class Q protein
VRTCTAFRTWDLLNTFPSFYNNIWLIFNDVVIGTTMATILCENHMYFGRLLHDYTKVSPMVPDENEDSPFIDKTWAIDNLNDALEWLDNWPVGLKLNTELSRALCLSFMVLTNIWGRKDLSSPTDGVIS